MKHTTQGLLMALALLAGNGAWAKNECTAVGKHIVDANLRFSLAHSQVPGQLAVSEHSLKVAGVHYTLESVSQARGLMALMFSGQLVQKSEGLVDNRDGLVPLYYAEKRGKKPLVETAVNGETKEVVFKKNGLKVPLEKGLQDRMSMIYQISALLRCNPSIKTGEQLSLRVMGTGRVASEVFTLKGAEELTLNLGKGPQAVAAQLFESKPENAEDEVVKIWFAKQMNWHPIQIQLLDPDGKSLTQTLIGLNQTNQ